MMNTGCPFPHLSPLPQAGEEANNTLREFYIDAINLFAAESFVKGSSNI